MEEFKMNIRKWFGSTEQYDSNTEFNRCLDKLLVLYRRAIVEYLESALPLEDVQELIISAYRNNSLPKGKIIFLNWFEEKGLSQIQLLANKKDTKNEVEVIAEIEYFYFLLNEEMDFAYPEDVRASLINIVNELPVLIKEVAEKKSVFVTAGYQIIDDYYSIDQRMSINQSINQNIENTNWYQIIDSVQSRGYTTQYVSVDVKPALKQVSFF